MRPFFGNTNGVVIRGGTKQLYGVQPRRCHADGMVVRMTLFDDSQTWRTATEDVGGRQVRIYRRA